jgi:hypothetical protein
MIYRCNVFVSKVGSVCRIPADKQGPPLGCFKCGKQAKLEVLTETHTHYQMRRFCEGCSAKLIPIV